MTTATDGVAKYPFPYHSLPPAEDNKHHQQHVEDPQQRQQQQQRRSSRRQRILHFFGAVAAGLLLLNAVKWAVWIGEIGGYPGGRGGGNGRGERGGAHRGVGKEFHWDDIKGSSSLEFRPCFDHFQCAKLLLPLDYFNGTHPNATVSLAVIKLPATVPIDDPRYAGPILINPGGPGGSGVSMALSRGAGLQAITSAASDLDPNGLYYDILSFDPRGIGLTEPVAKCMPNNPAAWSWELRQKSEGDLDSSDAALGRLWAMHHAYGSSCRQAVDEESEPDIKQYMSTASVARDMLELAEKHAEWVAEEKSALGQRSSNRRQSCQKGAKPAVSVYQRGEIKVQYWGFSYGTYLGATFASMFPDRVGRFTIDGVVNVHDYDYALGQGSLHDTERAMNVFYTSCLLSGPKDCSLAANSTSIANLEERVQHIIKSLYHNPIAVNTHQGPELITYSVVRSLIFSALYNPAGTYPFIAELLAAVERRSGKVLDQLAEALTSADIYSCPIKGDSSPTFNPWQVAQDAILCGDGHDLTSDNITSFQSYWHLLEDISPAGGSLWAILRLRCSAWPIPQLYRFGASNAYGGNTSHPILLISTTADPVTPLKSARIMAAKFPGSGLLIQDSAGHCSLSTPAACTIAAVKRYFQTGELPGPGTVCVPPASPFSLNSTDPNSPFYDPTLGQTTLSEEETGLDKEMRAARELQDWAAAAAFLGRPVVKPGVQAMLTSKARR